MKHIDKPKMARLGIYTFMKKSNLHEKDVRDGHYNCIRIFNLFNPLAMYIAAAAKTKEQ